MLSNDELIGKRLGTFIVEALLNVSANGRMYRGRDVSRDRLAVLKVIEPEVEASVRPEEYRTHVQLQARSLAHVRHPRLVQIYQSAWAGNLFYMAMSYVEGLTLREVLDKKLSTDQLLTPHEVMAWLMQLAPAIDYMHQTGIFHRNIKPSNIILSSRGPVLSDYGLIIRATAATTSNPFGSVHYTPPEQSLAADKVVPQSDQYALAVTVYECLTGRPPFTARRPMEVALKHLNELPSPPSEFTPSLPADVDAVLLRALSKEPQARYRTIGEFTSALQVALGLKQAK